MTSRRDPGEPILVSDASRKAYLRYCTTGDSAHEIIADAIRAAEIRTLEAVLKALNTVISLDGGRLLLDSKVDKDKFFESVARELGREHF